MNKVRVLALYRELGPVGPEFMRVELRLGVSPRASARGEWVHGQAGKGARWMPWHQEAMKDVDSCEKLRGAA